MAFVSTSGVCRSWKSAHMPLANLVRPFDSPCYLSHFTRHRCKREPEPAEEELKEGKEEAAAKMKKKQKNRDIQMGL
jgi:hypothetical protein